MKIKTVLLCALAVLCAQASLTWGGPIYRSVTMLPLNLITPLGNLTPSEKIITNIACFDVTQGHLSDCTYDIQITGLVQPDTDPSNNGGHSHGGTHPVGDLQMTFPATGIKSQFVSGHTWNSYVRVEHTIPEVSGKIETIFNFHVPPGSYTISPESCDASRSYWCFNTTVDVGVATDLLPLADPRSNPGVAYPYIRVRNAMGHTDDVAYSGTIDTLFFLNNIASAYNDEGYTLSVNDMSLPRGGLFDVFDVTKAQPAYQASHNYHRTGQSADINKNNGNCLLNKVLRQVVDEEMPIEAGSPFAKRKLPSYGRFLCEAGRQFGYTNNIHIDFDGMVF